MLNLKRIRVLLAVCLLLHLSPSSSSSDHHSQFVYTGFTGTSLALDGVARVTPGGLLELTNNTQRIKGHAFHPTPVSLRRFPSGTVRSFSTYFVFAILPSGDTSGHGLALVVAPSRDLSTAFPTQFLGLLNGTSNGQTTNHMLAVEMDTILNIELQDINDNHVGIDVDDLRSLQSHDAGFYDDESGVFRRLDLVSYEAMQVWVDYDEGTTQITVTMAPIAAVAKPVRPLLSARYNLSKVLLDPSYIGFSSSTGTLSGQHYVLGWSFSMDSPAPAIDISKLPKLPRDGHKDRTRLLDIVLPLATAVFLVVFGTGVFLIVLRHHKFAELREDWEVEFGAHRFSYKDLFYATEGFKTNHLLGIGGFGRVYRGVLPFSKLEVAVKRVSHDSKQGMKEFIAEVVTIGRIHHRNLVQLLGYCRRKDELLLVYDYMPNGSLDKYLHAQVGVTLLDWDKRFQIIKGIASALLYLHEEWEKIIIHRDVKASNVLLDNDMNGRLGDFGLARLYDHGTDPQTTHVVGTIGYLAPELARSGKATPLTDVYAFGVFLLEVTCGRKPITPRSQGSQLMLVDWVLENFHKGALTNTVDVKLQGNYNVVEACLALKLGLLCSHPFETARPSMRQVMQYLEGEMTLPALALANINFHTLALMQREGFDSYIMSYPSSMMSLGTVSVLSEGR